MPTKKRTKKSSRRRKTATNPLPLGRRVKVKAIRIAKKAGRKVIQVWK